METVDEYEQKYVDEEGTQVRKKITIRRIAPTAPVADSMQPWELIAPSDQSNFEQSFLTRHNQLRALHQAPPLQLSRKLNRYAQNWADRLAQVNLIQHRPDPKRYGENLYWKSSPMMKCEGEEAVNSWYEEIDLYKPEWYGADPPEHSIKDSGHFTQLIWKASQYVGLGVAIDGNSFFVVANYWPNGNYFTTYVDNVIPLQTTK